MKTSKPKLRIDGDMGGTGVQLRGKANYEEPEEWLELATLEISERLRNQIARWQSKYVEHHCAGYKNQDLTERLDKEGIDIARRVADELPNFEVEYFSDAKLKIKSID